MTRTTLHRWNAYFLCVFIVLHLVNHSALLLGREAHLGVLETLQPLYRTPLIEFPLLFLFAVQIVLGISLIWKRGRPKGAWAWAQALSGGYIAFFLLQHVSAALMLRLGWPNLETNTWWAASVVSASPFGYYFIPYYILAITAVFTHTAAALRFRNWPKPATRMQTAMPFVGLIFGCAVVLSLSLGSAAELPSGYQDYLASFF